MITSCKVYFYNAIQTLLLDVAWDGSCDSSWCWYDMAIDGGEAGKVSKWSLKTHDSAVRRWRGGAAACLTVLRKPSICFIIIHT